jgi:hypothetical protein
MGSNQNYLTYYWAQSKAQYYGRALRAIVVSPIFDKADMFAFADGTFTTK